jgi:hypothetical protein
LVAGIEILEKISSATDAFDDNFGRTGQADVGKVPTELNNLGTELNKPIFQTPAYTAVVIRHMVVARGSKS